MFESRNFWWLHFWKLDETSRKIEKENLLYPTSTLTDHMSFLKLWTVQDSGLPSSSTESLLEPVKLLQSGINIYKKVLR